MHACLEGSATICSSWSLNMAYLKQASAPVGGGGRVAVAQLERGEGEGEGLDGHEDAQVQLGACAGGWTPEEHHGVPVEQHHLSPQQQRLHPTKKRFGRSNPTSNNAFTTNH